MSADSTFGAPVMNYRYIAVEGNIGSGKTTLATMLAAHLKARLVLEEFADNTFLPKFYAEPERYAFPLELSFLADRYKQLKGLLPAHDLFGEKVVADYVFTKSKLFARTNLKEDEYELFQKFFDIINQHLPQPDLIIYLHAPIARLQQNIARRGRTFEQAIPDEYLDKVELTYQQFLKQGVVRTLVVDMNEVDFLARPVDFERLVGVLEGERLPRIEYFPAA